MEGVGYHIYSIPAGMVKIKQDEVYVKEHELFILNKYNDSPGFKKEEADTLYNQLIGPSRRAYHLVEVGFSEVNINNEKFCVSIFGCPKANRSIVYLPVSTKGKIIKTRNCAEIGLTRCLDDIVE